jgi:hypothetical protein
MDCNDPDGVFSAKYPFNTFFLLFLQPLNQ